MVDFLHAGRTVAKLCGEDAVMAELHKNLIGGAWVEGASATRNVNPSNTDDVVGEYAQADAAQTEPRSPPPGRLPRLVAHDPAGAARHPAARLAEILARRDELAACWRARRARRSPEAVGEATRAGQIFDFFAGEALRIPGEKFASVRPGVDVEVTREPVGVIGIIAPWNFPIAIPAWKIAPALAFGNTVLFKPADLVPGCAHALAEILVRAGVPEGRLQPRRWAAVRSSARRCSTSKGVDAITFTGSVATGKRVAAACAERMRKFQLEMGGKNPLVVLADADLEQRRRMRGQRRLLLDRAALHGLVADHRRGGGLPRVSRTH